MFKLMPLALVLTSTMPVAAVGLMFARHDAGAGGHSATTEPPRTLAVTGVAHIHVVPDKATFTVTIDAADVDKMRAQQLAQDKMAKVIDNATRAGIDPSGLTIASVALAPEYHTDRFGRPLYLQVKRWVATRNLTLRVDDLKNMNAIFGGVIEGGGVLQGDVAFDTSRLEEVRAQARLRAAEAAKQKASTLVEALGAKLGRPTAIAEQDPAYSGPWNYKNAMEDWRSGAFVDGAFSAGSMTVSGHVNVTFEII